MRSSRLALFAFALLLWAGPASATFVEGTRGAATDTTAGNDVSASPLATIPIGSHVFVYCAGHATGLTTSTTATVLNVTDTDGHTWTRIVERSIDGGAQDRINGWFYVKTVAPIGTGDSITCDMPATSDGKSIRFVEFTAGAGSTINVAGTDGGDGTGTTYDSGGGISGLSSVERLWLGGVMILGAAEAITCDTDYTCQVELDSGVGGVDIESVTGYRVLTATGDEFNGTFGDSAIWDTTMAVIDEVPAGGGNKKCPGALLGFSGCQP